MELEQLKAVWDNAGIYTNHQQSDMVGLLRKESRQPLTLLKKNFKRGIVLLPALFAISFNSFSKHHDLLRDGLFWFYVLFCMATLSYFIISLRLVSGMMRADDAVFHHVQHQFNLLEKIFTWRRAGTRLMILVFVILLETLLYFQQEPSLVKWYGQPLVVRLGGYAAAAAALYILTHYSFKYRYEKYLLHLNKLLTQLH